MSENTKTRGTSRFVKRILLCGLEKSGRSSIRRIIVKGRATRKIEENGVALSYFQWHLTKNPDSPTITVLDLGGQWSVLEKFILKLSSSAFYGIQALLFIVDISEKNTFKSAHKYFKLVQQRVQDSSPSARNFVFLNKVDQITKSSEIKKRAKQLKKSFQTHSDDKIGFYETTINDNSANEALLAVLGEIMPEAEKQIEAHLEELRRIPTQAEKGEIIIAYDEPLHPIETALEFGIESEKTTSEIIQPLDSSFPEIPIPSMPSSPMISGSTPLIEERTILEPQVEEVKIEEQYEIKALQEVLNQTRETLELSIVSLLTHEGKSIIKIGKNFDEFDETFKIAHRTFESVSKHIPEGLEQLIIETDDSFVTITLIDETLLLITKGMSPFNLEISQKLMEYARKVANHALENV